MKSVLKLAILFTTTCSLPAIAHNVWLEQAAKRDDYVVKFGHMTTEAYPAHKLTSVTAILQDNNPQPLTTHMVQGEAHTTLPTDTQLVLIHFNNGTWCKLPNGKYVERSQAKAVDVATCMSAQKVGKAVIKRGDTFLKSQHDHYELIPQNQPEVGKPLAVLALQNGKPLQGIGIGEGEDSSLQKTNAQGIAYYIPKPGLNKIWAEFTEETPNNQEYKSISTEYLLTFELN